MSETPSMATAEGWRGPLKEDKSDKSQCLLGMRLCVRPPCQLPKAPSSSVCGGLGVWSLCSVTGITGAQLDHLLPHPRNHGLGCQGLPEPGSWPIVVVPGVDPEIWWVVSENNLFSSGPIVCRWGRVWWVKEMATHSSVLAWRIPGTGEPGGLPSMGLHRVRHD